jgi:uncharacterized damage-inducible protein DinB
MNMLRSTSQGVLSLMVLIYICPSGFAQTTASAPQQADVRSTILKHWKISRDFTVKVAEQMPEADYAFKLTPPQMNFAEQMVHLAETFEEFLAPFSAEKLNFGKPASMGKADVLTFMKKSFDISIERVSKLTPEQIAKSYKNGQATVTGLDLLMELFDHTTHHRASAEMYLRAKGITPTPYEF